jgi:hypothetical protein
LPALTLLQGCSQETFEAQLEDYSAKLARVLAQDVSEPAQVEWQRLPRTRELRLTFDETSINLLEFIQLMECDLNALVADHNSSLGRQATSSQQLIYQLKFLASVQRCIPRIQSEHPELAETLSSVSLTKQQQLPGYIWQATLGGTEFRSFWQPGTGQDYTAVELSEVDLALARLQHLVEQWLRGEYEVDPTELESLLGKVRQGDGGRLMLAWLQVENNLDKATAVLRARGESQPLCYPAMRTQQADIFRNVVQQDFVGAIQPVVARMNRRYYNGYQLVQSLESALTTAEPGAYRAWRLQRDERMSTSRDSVAEHVAALEPLMAQCGFLPE